MTTYVDAGWTGTPAAVSAALAGYGFQVNTDSTVSVIDPTLAGTIVAVTGYRVLDGVAYVLLRSTAAIPLPTGVTAIGADLTAAISGVYMSGTTTSPTVVPNAVFFGRWTATEVAAAWAASVGNPQLGAGLLNGLALGAIDLSGAATSAWMDAMVTAGVLTAARKTTILTP